MKLSDFIVKDAIVPELEATERDAVIRELVSALAAAKAVQASDVDAIVKAIIDREKHGSTGFGKGVAVPHVKHPAIKKRVGAIGRSAVGVDFAALDQAPVYSVFLLLSPPNNPDGHLQAMENIFRNLQQDTFRRFLRQSDTQQKIIELIEEADQTSAAR
ncbi:MAG TPA: PTS sugar transporter subunit IIA [Phycisphaerae bacterium]|nr:PTS sugar transporter subunit IIA [Phycisphaerae bacterium]